MIKKGIRCRMMNCKSKVYIKISEPSEREHVMGVTEEVTEDRAHSMEKTEKVVDLLWQHKENNPQKKPIG